MSVINLFSINTGSLAYGFNILDLDTKNGYRCLFGINIETMYGLSIRFEFLYMHYSLKIR
jgi:hypothetical protein